MQAVALLRAAVFFLVKCGCSWTVKLRLRVVCRGVQAGKNPVLR